MLEAYFPLWNESFVCDGSAQQDWNQIDHALGAQGSSYLFSNNHIFCLEKIYYSGQSNWMAKDKCRELVEKLRNHKIPLNIKLLFTLGRGILYKHNAEIGIYVITIIK